MKCTSAESSAGQKEFCERGSEVKHDMANAEYPAVACTTCGHQREGAQANEMNFVLFSTSGVHGTYTTIEEIERGLLKYGENPEFLKDESEESIPEDWNGTTLTIGLYHPRIVGVGYGNIEVKLPDIPFLKALRKSSWDAVRKIGSETGGHDEQKQG